MFSFDPGCDSFDVIAAGMIRTVPWGRPHEVGAAAYWIACAHEVEEPVHYRIGETLSEEVVACVLGGFGLPAEVGLAAFDAVRAAGLICADADADDIEAVLRSPLFVDGRPVRYRFPQQRAKRVAAALWYLAVGDAPDGGAELRNWLLGCPGVGPKTASWVARNWATAPVAIIDIHVQRAGVSAGVFDPSWRLPQDYCYFEHAFLAFAAAGGVTPALLDTCMWQQLHGLGRLAHLVVGYVPDVPVRQLHRIGRTCEGSTDEWWWSVENTEGRGRGYGHRQLLDDPIRDAALVSSAAGSRHTGNR